MKRVIAMVTVFLFCSVLWGTPFEDFIREAGNELAGRINTAIPLKVVLDNSDGQIQQTPGTAKMQGFIRELLDSELQRSETLNPIDLVRTDPILQDLAGTNRDYNFFNELGRRIHQNLNVITDALLEIRITDLGKTLKLELRLIDAITATDLAVVKKEYAADRQTNKLLGKPLSEKPEYSPGKPPQQPTPEPKPPETRKKIVFSEDFSGYQEGDPLPGWGKGVVVVKMPEGKKFVGSQIKGKHVIGRDIGIPDPGEISFTFSRVVENPSLILYDSDNSEVRVTLARNWRGYWVWITGSVAMQFDCGDLNQFRLTREGNTHKVYINGKYMLSGVFENIREITGFKLDLHQGQLYTDFQILNLKPKP